MGHTELISAIQVTDEKLFFRVEDLNLSTVFSPGHFGGYMSRMSPRQGGTRAEYGLVVETLCLGIC